MHGCDFAFSDCTSGNCKIFIHSRISWSVSFLYKFIPLDWVFINWFRYDLESNLGHPLQSHSLCKLLVHDKLRRNKAYNMDNTGWIITWSNLVHRIVIFGKIFFYSVTHQFPVVYNLLIFDFCSLFLLPLALCSDNILCHLQ